MEKFKAEVQSFFDFCMRESDDILARQSQVDSARGKAGSVRIEYSRPCPSILSHISQFRRLIRPRQVIGQPLIRVGAMHDGGYLMLEPGRGGIAYSLGIACEVSWDTDMAERGYTIYQYDGSVEGPPHAHPNFAFEKLYIGADDSRPGYRSLGSLLDANNHTHRTDLILQMDIEGAEWQVLDTVDEKHLRCFSQIIVELHLPTFELLLLPVRNHILSRLAETHQVIHAHVNNSGNTLVFGEEQIWTALELTYLRRDNYRFTPSRELYPLPLDAPCLPYLADITPGYIGR